MLVYLNWTEHRIPNLTVAGLSTIQILLIMGKSVKKNEGFKKAHHGKLGEKPSKKPSNAELGIEALDNSDFERYCGNCDYFKDADYCPFYPTTEDTLWKEELGCENFWD